MSASRRGVAYNAIVVYLGKVAGILISTLTLSLILRYLGTERYGDFSTINTFSAILVAITDLGLGWVVARELAKGNTRALRPLGTFKLLVTVVIVTLAALLVQGLGYNDYVKQGVVMISVFTFFTALNNYQIGILQGAHALNRTAYTDTISRLVNLVAVFGVVHWNLGFYPMLFTLNLAGFSTLLLNSYFIRQLDLKADKGDAQRFKEYIPEIVIMGLVTGLTYLVNKNDILILARLKPSLDVGIYSTAYRLLDVAMALPAVFVAAFYPLISRLYTEPDSEERKRVLRLSFISLSGMAAFTATAGILWAPLIMRVIGGRQALESSTVSLYGRAITSVEVLQILCVFLFFSFFGSYLSSLLIASQKQRFLVLLAAIALVFNVVSNAILIPHYSYLASATLTVLTEFILTFPMLIYLIRQRLVIVDFLTVFRLVLSAVLASLCTVLISRVAGVIGLLVTLPVGYVLFTYLLGGEPRQLLRQLFHKLRYG